MSGPIIVDGLELPDLLADIEAAIEAREGDEVATVAA